MIRYSKVVFLLLLAIGCSCAGCRKNNSSPAPASSSQVVNQYQHAEGGTTLSGDTKYFKGSIGSALGLQMKLVREGAILSGTYFYQKVGTKIDIRGTIDANNNVVLEEFDSNGKKTGVFKGTWKTNAEGLTEIEGNWTRPDGSKAAVFSLAQEPIEFSNGVAIIARPVQVKNKKLKDELDAEYPP